MTTTGTVTSWLDPRGIGVIGTETDRIPFAWTALSGPWTPKPGDRVIFELVETTAGKLAVNIQRDERETP